MGQTGPQGPPGDNGRPGLNSTVPGPKGVDGLACTDKSGTPCKNGENGTNGIVDYTKVMYCADSKVCAIPTTAESIDLFGSKLSKSGNNINWNVPNDGRMIIDSGSLQLNDANVNISHWPRDGTLNIEAKKAIRLVAMSGDANNIYNEILKTDIGGVTVSKDLHVTRPNKLKIGQFEFYDDGKGNLWLRDSKKNADIVSFAFGGGSALDGNTVYTQNRMQIYREGSGNIGANEIKPNNHAKGYWYVSAGLDAGRQNFNGNIIY